VPPMPPPVRAIYSGLRLLQQRRLGQQVNEGRGGDRLGAEEDAGFDRRRRAAQRIVCPGRVFVVGAWRAQPRPHRQEPHRRRVPSLVDVVVRGVVGLSFRQSAAQPSLVFRGRHQPLVVVEERVLHWFEAEIGQIWRAKSYASSEKRGGPTSSRVPKVRSVMA
jgi:hypothetical protein